MVMICPGSSRIAWWVGMDHGSSFQQSRIAIALGFLPFRALQEFTQPSQIGRLRMPLVTLLSQPYTPPSSEDDISCHVQEAKNVTPAATLSIPRPKTPYRRLHLASR